MRICLTMVGLAATLNSVHCKNIRGDDAKKAEQVRESANSIPPPDVGTREEDTSAKKMRPDAWVPGAAALEISGLRSCLALRVAEDFLLTAASCAVSATTGYPFPTFVSPVLTTLLWKEGEAEKKVLFSTRAVYPHPSYLKHFQDVNPSDRYSDKKALSQVFDLALIRIAPEKSKELPPIAQFAKEVPEGVQLVTALQGVCQGTVNNETPSAKGGRELNVLSWPKGEARAYLEDDFSSHRLLFDCDGFVGAPISFVSSKAPESPEATQLTGEVESETAGASKAEVNKDEVIGLTSWMHPGGLERGITQVAGDPGVEGTIPHWIKATVQSPPTYSLPPLNTEFSCQGKKVVSSIGHFTISFDSLKVLIEGDLINRAEVSFEMDLEVRAPPENLVVAASPPLIAVGSSQVEKKTYTLVRDVRQPSLIQYTSTDRIQFGEEQLKLTFVSTDRKQGLIIITAENKETKKERTLNIFIERFSAGQLEPSCNRIGLAKPTN